LVIENLSMAIERWVHDKNLHLPGRAELLLCPEILGGAAAPPYQGHEDFCHMPLSGWGGEIQWPMTNFQ
jgi:hypothetical protein